MGFAVSQPTIISPTPSAAPNVITVCSVRLISSRLFCPMSSASTAFGPTDSPTIRLTKIPTSATQLPTAASAVSPANRPTTATSAELKSCCRMLLNASGSAKRMSFPARPPCSMSISLCFVCAMKQDSPCMRVTALSYHAADSGAIRGKRISSL